MFKRLALRDMGLIGAAGFGVGAAGRGLYGLYNMLARKSRGPEEVRPTNLLETEFPIRDEDEEKEKEAQVPAEMLPSESGVQAAALPSSVVSATPVGGLVDEQPATKEAAGLIDWLSGLGAGDHTQSKTGIPWYLTGGAVSGAGGFGGGWKVMDALLDQRREAAHEEELEKAQGEFRDAITSRRGRRKSAAAEYTLGENLDLLYDTLTEKYAALEKSAEGSSTGNAIGTLLGMYGLYATGTGLMGGMLMYDSAKKRQRRALLEKAKKERERKTFERSPPRIEAFPSISKSANNLVASRLSPSIK